MAKSKYYSIIPPLMVFSLFCTGCSFGGSDTKSTNEETADASVVSYIDGLLVDRSKMSEEQISVLEQVKRTGSLAEDQWKEANDRALDCMRSKGLSSVSVIYDGAEAYIYQELNDADQVSESESSSITHDCEVEQSSSINSLYSYLYGGARNSDPEEYAKEIYNCLVDSGAIERSVTFEDFYSDYSGTAERYGPQNGDSFVDCWNS